MLSQVFLFITKCRNKLRQRQRQHNREGTTTQTTYIPPVRPEEYYILSCFAVVGGILGGVIKLIRFINPIFANNSWVVMIESLYDGCACLLGLWCGLSEATAIKKQIRGLEKNQKVIYDTLTTVEANLEQVRLDGINRDRDLAAYQEQTAATLNRIELLVGNVDNV